MLEGSSGEESNGQGSRKNSILVKDEYNSNRQNLQSAHPHFVEQVPAHRTPPGTASGQPETVNGNSQPNVTQQGAGQPEATTHPGLTPLQQNQSQPRFPNPKVGPQATQERLDQFHMGSSTTTAGAPNAAPKSPTTRSPSASISVGSNQPNNAGASSLLAQTQAEAQNSSSAGGPTWSRTQPFPSQQDLAQGSTPSRVGSPQGQSTDPELPNTFSGRATSKQRSDPRIPMDDGKIHILLGVTGSLHMSSVKSIIVKLQSIYGDRVAIQVIVTPAAEKMISSLAGKDSKEKEQKAEAKSEQLKEGFKEGTSSSNPHHPSLRDKDSHPNLRIWHDADEWESWRGRNDPVIHIELRRWADILVIAPLSANTLGKIAMGLCDNLLTNVVRAWNSQYPILIAPAMVAYAYNHPATKHHLKTIREEMKWIEILRPTEKVAGSTGGIGMGGMMPWNEIVDRVVHKLGGYPDDEDEEEDDEDEDEESLRGRVSSRDLDVEDEDDLDDEDEDDEDILKEGIEGSHQGSPHGSPI